MKVIRRIFGNIDSYEKKTTLDLAFECEMEMGFFNIDLDEKSQAYNKVKKYISSLDLQDTIIGTEYTKEEIVNAEFLILKGIWSTGYPEPQDPIQSLVNTYSDTCPECGVHGEQKAPFQMKEPKLGKHKLMQLNWTFDELFCERGFYESFFKNLGIDKREAILYKKDVAIKSVVQLVIPVANFKLDMKDRGFSRCHVCNRVKYNPVETDFFPAPKNEDFIMVKTQESFGSGYSSFRKILIKNEIMDKMIRLKVAKEYQFIPCK